MKFSTMAAQFLELHVNLHNRATERRRKESLLRAHLLPVLGDRDIAAIDALTVAEFTAALREQGLANSTTNNALALLGQMLTQAVKWNYLRRAPEVPRLKVIAGEPRWLADAEARALLVELAEPYRALVTVGLHTGLRIGELISLRVGDVDVATRTLTVMRGSSDGPTKSGRVRRLPLNESAWVAVAPLLRGLPSAPLFAETPGQPIGYRRAYRLFKEAATRAGMPELHPHVLRHSAASKLVQAGVPLYTVSKILGHASLSTTQRYAHLDQGTLRDAVAALEQDAVEWGIR